MDRCAGIRPRLAAKGNAVFSGLFARKAPVNFDYPEKV
jgi:hypothetical protein